MIKRTLLYLFAFAFLIQNIFAQNEENIIKEDFKNISKENINIDKNNKANYHSPRGDIGDIILNTPAYQSSSDISDSSVYYDSGRKVNERIIEKEVMEDPERTASAIRTMIAKDKDKDKYIVNIVNIGKSDATVSMSAAKGNIKSVSEVLTGLKSATQIVMKPNEVQLLEVSLE